MKDMSITVFSYNGDSMRFQTTKRPLKGPSEPKKELLKRQMVKKWKPVFSLPPGKSTHFKPLTPSNMLILCAVLLFIFLLTMLPGERKTILRIEDINLPLEENLIEHELIAYASPETDA